MKLRVQYSTLAAALLVWTLGGYPFIASFSNLVGIPNTSMSFLFRGAFAGLALLLVFSRGSRRSPWNLLFMLFLTFWAMYFIRLLNETAFVAHMLGRPAYIYWAFAVGTCFLPALALAKHGRSINVDDLYPWLVGVCAAVLVVVLVAGDTMVQNRLGRSYDTGRLALDSLNPISIGHLAASLLLAAYWRLRFRKIGLFSSPHSIALILLCIFVLFASGSRGPLVALLLGGLFLEAVKGWRMLILMAVVSTPLFVLLSVDLTDLDRLLGVTIFSRFEAALSVSDMSSTLRLAQMVSGWQIFLDNPLFGGALEDPAYKIYPHNILIESFMSVGFFGGILLILVCLLSTYLAFRGGKRSPAQALIGGLFVQYFVAAQLSGSLWAADKFWVLMAIIISTAGLHGASTQTASKSGKQPQPASPMI